MQLFNGRKFTIGLNEPSPHLGMHKKAHTKPGELSKISATAFFCKKLSISALQTAAI
jgi:hypothetical protein